MRTQSEITRAVRTKYYAMGARNDMRTVRNWGKSSCKRVKKEVKGKLRI